MVYIVDSTIRQLSLFPPARRKTMMSQLITASPDPNTEGQLPKLTALFNAIQSHCIPLQGSQAPVPCSKATGERSNSWERAWSKPKANEMAPVLS